jgi:hypothetical protein
VQQERELLRTAQSEAVMPLIGPLLDAWEGGSDFLNEYPALDKQLRRIHRAMEHSQPAAQQEPINVAQAYAMAQVCLDLHDALGCKWGDNPYLAIDRLKTTPPASWMEMVTANLVREGVNKHKARELAGHFYGLAAPIPDAITDNSESPEFRSGWNECRELTIQMRKS